MEQLFEVDQPNTSLSIPTCIDGFLPLYLMPHTTPTPHGEPRSQSLGMISPVIICAGIVYLIPTPAVQSTARNLNTVPQF